MFAQASCDQGAVSTHFLASSCMRHYVVNWDYRPEGRRSRHTDTHSAHQFDTDDERGGGRCVVHNWDLRLGSLLERRRRKRNNEGSQPERWAFRCSSVDPQGGWSHLGFFMCIKTFTDLVLVNVTESSDLGNNTLVGKNLNGDAVTNLPSSDWLDWGICTVYGPVSQHSIWWSPPSDWELSPGGSPHVTSKWFPFNHETIKEGCMSVSLKEHRKKQEKTATQENICALKLVPKSLIVTQIQNRNI